jgi:hypothetical protein
MRVSLSLVSWIESSSTVPSSSQTAGFSASVVLDSEIVTMKFQSNIFFCFEPAWKWCCITFNRTKLLFTQHPLLHPLLGTLILSHNKPLASLGQQKWGSGSLLSSNVTIGFLQHFSLQDRHPPTNLFVIRSFGWERYRQVKWTWFTLRNWHFMIMRLTAYSPEHYRLE